MRHFFAKFLDPVFDTRKLHGSTGVVGCLHHAEIAREVEGLVHIEGCYELPSEKVTAGIAGYDNSEQGFVVEPRGPEQGCQAVDKRRHIRGQGIVVVWTEEQDRVSPLDRRVDIFHHGSAVEAFSLLTKVQAHLVWTSRTVHESAVSQVDLLDPDPVIQALLYFLPDRQGIGGPVV